MTCGWRACAMSALLAPGLGAGAAGADAITLPSGVVVHEIDRIWDEDAAAIRIRYLVPRLREPASLYSADPERVLTDMTWLCETQIRRLFAPGTDPRDEGWEGAIVTMMDREIPFGEIDAEATQFFEGFLFTMDGCTLDLDLYHD